MQTEHHFKIEDAEKYGIEKAILLHNLRFWLDKELANSQGKNKKSKIFKHTDQKDYVWVYNSRTALGILFPYMAIQSIARWLLELERDGVVISGVFNKNKYDKTKWYSMPEYHLSIDQENQSIAQDIQSIAQNEQPIPDNNPDKNHIYNAADAASPMDFKSFLSWTRKSPQRHIQIIGEYADEKKIEFENKGQWQQFMKRNLRAATQLSPYTDEQLSQAMKKIKQDKSEYLTRWTLETLVKYLDH